MMSKFEKTAAIQLGAKRVWAYQFRIRGCGERFLEFEGHKGYFGICSLLGKVSNVYIEPLVINRQKSDIVLDIIIKLMFETSQNHNFLSVTCIEALSAMVYRSN